MGYYVNKWVADDRPIGMSGPWATSINTNPPGFPADYPMGLNAYASTSNIPFGLHPGLIGLGALIGLLAGFALRKKNKVKYAMYGAAAAALVGVLEVQQ